MYKTFDSVFAIIDFSILDEGSIEISEDIQSKFEARNQAKKDKNFSEADRLRDELLGA
jgi:cysteinyl-tRNA synthetase